MTKINFDTPNAPLTIIQSIKPNSRVLEFGCGNGYMTKYLDKELNCKVSVVEVDEKAGQEALQYAKDGLTGILHGNISNFYWEKKYADKEFDYILFSDILSHLINPQEVLKAASNLLKSKGSILLSVPNIAYNGVILGLLQEEFNYTKSGILDNNHLRFFSYFSLQGMFKKCGLRVFKEHTLLNHILESEFKDVDKDIPEPILSLLQNRKYGNVYQFVFELRAI